MGDPLDKYLAGHAEALARRRLEIEGEWDHVLVVPACAEDPTMLDDLAPAGHGRRALIIVVVNGRDDHGPHVHETNRRFLAELDASELHAEWGLGLRHHVGFDVLVVDRASAGRRFAPGDGVGLARKLGADLALALRDRIASDWIHFTDADAVLSPAYFDVDPGPAVGLVRRFRHLASGDPRIDDAQWRYELALRYYVLGLRRAGSPYAFHTIGSLVGLTRRAYASVRGVPRRQAGEDFYLLNKLAKIGAIHRDGGAPVGLRARASSRVPFGTGPAVRRLLEDPSGPAVYAPEVFAGLAAVLEILEHAGHTGAWDEAPLERLPPPLRAAVDAGLARLELRPAICDLARRHPASTRARHLHGWFDAFRTLKLVHALRDAGLPNEPWRLAFARADFLADVAAQAPVEGVLAQLIALEGG